MATPFIRRRDGFVSSALAAILQWARPTPVAEGGGIVQAHTFHHAKPFLAIDADL